MQNTERHLKPALNAILLCLLAIPTFAADSDKSPASTAAVQAVFPQVQTLYFDLHQHPELSFHEERTAATLAEGLRKLGFDVTSGVGRLGVAEPPRKTTLGIVKYARLIRQTRSS